jgi:hypothetical protein
LAVAEDLLRGTSKSNIDSGVTMCSIPAIPGVNYYFAVLDAGYYKVGRVPLESGQNTTTAPIQIPLTASMTELPIAPERRTLPLPVLQLTQAVETGRALPAEDPYLLPESSFVSSDTEDAIERILSSVSSAKQTDPKPTILEADAAASTGGELASLSTVIRNQFTAGSYVEAGKLIQDFLSIRRKPDIEARAHFYLGQIKYFGKDMRGAVLEFLLAEEYFYPETRKWLDACFSRLDSTAGS